MLSVCLTILLLAQSLSSWSAPVVLAATTGLKPLRLPAGSQTFQQFLKEGRHGPIKPYRLTGKLPPPPGSQYGKPGKILPSAEPPTMKPLSATLSQAFLNAAPGTQPLDLHSSDGRLEVQLTPGLFDLSHASVTGSSKTGVTGKGSNKIGSGTGAKGEGSNKGSTPSPSVTPGASSSSFSGSLIFSITEQHGYYVGEQIYLGEYSFILTDSHGHAVSGVVVRIPIALRYHYQEAVMGSFDLDPGRLFLGWPLVILNASKQHRIDTAAMQPLQNDPKTHTLTTPVRSLGPGPFDLMGDPSNESPPIPRLAGVQGNSGQLSYSYPLQTPPGPDGFGPDLQLSYSSETVNERHTYNQPSGPVGDGFSLSLGSITADVSNGTGATWYSISGVDGISDRIVPTQTPNAYSTQHLSYLKILYISASSCFHVWDTSGTYYEFGCTPSSLQFHTDTDGKQHLYRWDVNKIVAPNEGDTSTVKVMTISYFQDCYPIPSKGQPCSNPSQAGAAVHDASIKQITVMVGDINGGNDTVISTTDFYYQSPYTVTPWANAYGTNYNTYPGYSCSPPGPPANPTGTTTLRCDDPVDYYNGLPAPQVISTLSLEKMVSYVGADNSGLPAYQYSFAYQDTPFNTSGIGFQCADPTQPSGLSQYYEFCAGEHLLTRVTESVYNSGSWHQLKPVLFDYTKLYNTYTDFTQQLPPGSGNAYFVQTAWQYLADYVDTNTGVGSHIAYMTGYGNTHGTPIIYNGNQIVDDRYDPTYCFQHKSDCTGVFAGPQDGQWTVQVVTGITTLGSDSSDLSSTTTNYTYRLAENQDPNVSCPKVGDEDDCPVDTWRPLQGNDKDWQDYYDGEFFGFNGVTTTSPSGNVSVDFYYSTKGPAFAYSDYSNYTNGHLYEQDVYQLNTNWNKSYYTTCTTYDQYNGQSFEALPASATNAFGQVTKYGYDYTQGELPISLTDVNSKQTSTAYIFDGGSANNDKEYINVSEPGESGSYTKQSNTYSLCPESIPSSTAAPCFEINTSTSAYPTEVSSTFYDSQGRAVETSVPVASPNPGDGNDYFKVTITEYNDASATTWTSEPFVVAVTPHGNLTGTGWLDPAGITDYNGHKPVGTTAFLDALGRTIAVRDPLYNTSSEPGVTCGEWLSGSYTACTNYSIGLINGGKQDGNYYVTATGVDANGHVSESFTDALGRTVYTEQFSGASGGTLTAIQQTSMLYTILGQATQVQVQDLQPQSGQTIVKATTTATYDSLGRLTTLNDPDRGTHTYTYDPDGHVLTDVSGTRTLGSNYDLLGRLGCLQDAAPTINATGACSSGTNPYIQNTYDSSSVNWGSTDFTIGRLAKSVATTYYPGGSTMSSTENFEYDGRGRPITARLSLSLPTAWGVSSLPTYQMATDYTDADQPQTTMTGTLVSGTLNTDFTSTQVYDSGSGEQTGLGSNPDSGVANVASLVYNAHALPDTITFYTSAGHSSSLANEQFLYDGDLRPVQTTATWQSGSGSSGQIYEEQRTYDPTGNVSSLATSLSPVPGKSNSGGTETQDFCYNEQNQLVWAGNSGTEPSPGNGTCGSAPLASGLNNAAYSNSFVYTHLGEIWKGPLNGSSTQYKYLYCSSGSNTPHELTGIFPIGNGASCTNQTGAVYLSSYDAWGNVTSRTYNGSTPTLSYDLLDQLVEWNSGSTNREWYGYDASGQRTLTRSLTGSGTTITVYAFGHEYTYDGTGNFQSSIHYYTLAGRLIGELTANPGQNTNIFVTDALGSVIATFSNLVGSATILANQVYGPYGTQRYQSGPMPTYTTKGFTGQYADSVTGLDYYNARYYDPVAGVFLSADTIQGNAAGMNPYGYVGGNPVTSNDPTGHFFEGDGEEGYIGGGSESGDLGGGGGENDSAEEGGLAGAGGSSGTDGSGGTTPYVAPTTVESNGVTYSYDGETLSVQTPQSDGSMQTETYSEGDANYDTEMNQYLDAEDSGIPDEFGEEQTGEAPPTEPTKPSTSDTPSETHGGETKYYFRGTSKGYPGGPSAQRLGVTFASTDPAVATTFATQSESYGEGVVYIATPEDLEGVEISSGNVLASLESEVGVWILPEEFAERSSIAISANEARGILGDMGIDIPGSINGYDRLSSTLHNLSPLTPDQIEYFVQMASSL